MKRLLLLSTLFFTLVSVSSALPPALTEAEKITRLIAYIRHLDGAVFIRNGTDYTAVQAADHLQMKREKAPKYAKTAQDFIKNLATKSSFSDKPYYLRFQDGKTLPAGEVLLRELKRIESHH